MLKTKDYIYLDDDLLNSYLAQFEKGLLTKETAEHGIENTDSIGGASTGTIGATGIFGIGLKLQNEITENDNSVESEFTKNVVENVLSDYAVDLLIEDCDTNNLLRDFAVAKEGDFISLSSKFQIYDFEYLKSITELSLLKPLLDADEPPVSPGPQASKQERVKYQKDLHNYNSSTEKAENGFKLINDLSTFANNLFSDSILVTINNGLSICKRNKLRLNKAQISFENESNKHIKIFGIVSTVKKEIHSDGKNFNFQPNELDKVPSMLFDVLLSSFNMLHNNDKVIKPIAIYFEAE